MIDAETTLLEAVRDAVQAALSLQDRQCDVELDDIVPAIAGDLHVVIVPNGFGPGPRHMTSGTVIDQVVGCRVVVFQRMADVPRDRRRNVFLERTKGLNRLLNQVHAAIDFSYPVLDAANTSLGSAITEGEGFREPLKFAGVDPRPQTVMHDPYEAASNPRRGADPVLAIKRGINFSGARFLKVRT